MSNQEGLGAVTPAPALPVRAGAGGTLWQRAHAFGTRQSGDIGLAKTGLQQACTAAMNASRIVNWLEQTPCAKTRVTRFTA